MRDGLVLRSVIVALACWIGLVVAMHVGIIVVVLAAVAWRLVRGRSRG